MEKEGKKCCEKCTDGSISGIWCNDENCDCHEQAKDGNGGWEETFKKRFFNKDGNLYIPIPSPELIGLQKKFIRQIIASEIRLAEERLVAKLKKIHEEYGIISITDLEHIQHED